MRRSIAWIAAGAMLLGFSAASAQEDLEKGMSGAQIFAKDCAICHKTPQAVVKGGPPGEGFLRQHYTSGREVAAKVAAYLNGIKAPVRAERASKPKSAAKPKAAGDKDKGSKDAKPTEKKPSDAKPSEAKAPDKKEPAETKQ